MKVTGTIERIRINEEKKIVELIIQTAEEHPNFYIITYFIREGRSFPKLTSGDMVLIDASLKGRKWADPETGEIKYFMSLNASKVINLEGLSNED